VPPRGGTGKTLRSSIPGRVFGRGWRLAHGSAREALGELGRRLTVVRGVLETLRIDGSWARELRRRSPGRGMQPRRLGARRCTWLRGLEPPMCAGARDRTPNRGGGSSGGSRTPGEHRRAASAWPGDGVVAERTPGGSKASKWACRPFTGEPSVGGKWTARAAHLRCVEATGLASARNVRHGSCVPGPPSGGRERQRAGADRESDRESPAGTAPAAVGERTHTEASGPRERVRLPGKGKLWRGAPGTRAA